MELRTSPKLISDAKHKLCMHLMKSEHKGNVISHEAYF